MSIRNYQPGDEGAQVAIYNEAASGLPAFKPATVDEIRRRTVSPKKDRTTRFFALENGAPVGYIACQTNGRVGYPWCRKGAEHHQEALLNHALEHLKSENRPRAFSALRGDWEPLAELLLNHGFEQNREMLNFQMNLFEMPTASPMTRQQFDRMKASDFDEVLELARSTALFATDEEIRETWLSNPWLDCEDLFILRNHRTGQIDAVGVVVLNPSYADNSNLDHNMPCFRLGAFGTEGLTWKRINGLFSFLVRDPNQVSPLGLDLLKHVSAILDETDLSTVAAQVCSDAKHLVHFYRQYFEPQGSFPLYEIEL